MTAPEAVLSNLSWGRRRHCCLPRPLPRSLPRRPGVTFPSEREPGRRGENSAAQMKK